MKLLINGAKGRLGRVITETATNAGHLVMPVTRGENASGVIGGCDAVIDVSLPEATVKLSEICQEHGVPLIVGCTGHSEIDMEALRKASITIPVVMAPNFSIGVAVMTHLIREASRLLGKDYGLDVLDIHREGKKDSPSGIARQWTESMDRPMTTHSIRAGDGFGEHTVYFSGPGERIELSNRTHSRVVYANGALKISEWVQGRDAGLYTMADLLNIRESSLA